MELSQNRQMRSLGILRLVRVIYHEDQENIINLWKIAASKGLHAPKKTICLFSR